MLYLQLGGAQRPEVLDRQESAHKNIFTLAARQLLDGLAQGPPDTGDVLLELLGGLVVGCLLALLDAGAEKIFVVDEHGSLIDSDRLLTLMVKYAALATPGLKKIGIPVSASGEIDLLAAEFGFSVVRTRDSHLALMDAASDKEMRFVGGTKGGFIFNEFLFASDGMYSVAKLLEYLAVVRKSVRTIDQETPRLHFVKKNITCPWHHKGRVMRQLMKESEGMRRDLIEGVKLHLDRSDPSTSVLLNPDRARPVFHINAESADPDVAQRLCNEYVSKVRVWIAQE